MIRTHYTTQYLSGHGNFNAKLRYFRLKEQSWCHSCGGDTDETAWQVLAECPEYVEERSELLPVEGTS